MSKIETLKNNPKQRNIIMFGIGLGVLIAFAGAYMATKNNVKQEITGGSAAVVEAPNVKTATGASNSALYNEKVEQSNKLEAEKALEQEKTFVATPVNKGAFNTNSPIDDLDKQIKAETQKEETEKKVEEKVSGEKKEVNTSQNMPPVEPTPTQVQPVAPTQPQVVYKYIEKPQKKKFGSEEDRVLIALLSGANQIKNSNAETTFGGLDPSKMAQQNQVSSQPSQATINEQPSQQLLDKAGTIYNAVLETAINSDEPSPVLAKIVSGKLKGTRLIGKMVTSGEKVVIEFKTASVPSKEKSIAVSAIAIDPNSSRTGLASDVDRHYFLKYGVLLGAAFLGGYADALASQNTTTTQNADGSVLTKTGQLSDKQVTQQALGSVGKELANQTRSQVQSIKPTITVNAGSAIGVLLMEDFYVK